MFGVGCVWFGGTIFCEENDEIFCMANCGSQGFLFTRFFLHAIFHINADQSIKDDFVEVQDEDRFFG